MVKLLIGGSPCTHWSIAQSKNRETTAEGIGWELFRNYVIAKEKFQPDFFLYENNWSASKEIKAQIQVALNCELMRINSRLVSAQNRDRFYVFNWDVEQPKDRGILLRDILESGTAWQEKSYCLAANRGGHCLESDIKGSRYSYAAEPLVILSEAEMDYMVRETKDGRNQNDFGYHHDATQEKSRCLTANTAKGVPYNVVCEPVRIGTIKNSAKTQSKHDSQSYRVYSPDGKSVTICGEGGGVGAKTGLYAVPYGVAYRGRPDENGKNVKRFEGGNEEKANCLTTVQTDSMVAEPACLRYERTEEAKKLRKAYEAGEIHHGYHEFHELHPRPDGKTNTLTTVLKDNLIIIPSGDPIYEVKNGKITIDGKTYPIKLQDGYYIIRKLTPIECERLQTLPDGYTAAVSNTQRYRGLGNGWTAEVIIHILQGALKDIPRDEKIVVLSMYDGIATDRYCLDKMGFTNVEYHAYEIDKYATKVAMSNYPDIIQHGDAFQVRNDDWSLENY